MAIYVYARTGHASSIIFKLGHQPVLCSSHGNQAVPLKLLAFFLCRGKTWAWIKTYQYPDESQNSW